MFGWDASKALTSSSNTLRSNAWVCGGWPLTVMATLPPALVPPALSEEEEVPQAAVARPRPAATVRTRPCRNLDRVDIRVPF